MILQALYEYYQRKAADPESGVAPEGLGYVEIPFLVRLDSEGNFVGIEDTRFQDGKRLVGKKFLVPAPVSRTAGIKANLLWDKAEYALGIPDAKKLLDIEKKANKDLAYKEAKAAKDSSDIQSKAKERFRAFFEKIKELDHSDIKEIKAVLNFLENNPFDKINSHFGGDVETLNTIVSEGPNLSFIIQGQDSPVCSMPNILEKCSNKKQDDQALSGVCLITGERTPIARIHPMLKNVIGAQSSGAAIVSFNKPSFTSFGKDQNFNAPISESAAFAYTTALNMLLGKDSPNKMRIGDTTAVFWSEKKTNFESAFGALWGLPPKDNPDADIEAVKQLYGSIQKGSQIPETNTRFYILGLAPNAARLSVRFWQQGSIEEFSKNIRQHFDDLEIICSKKDRGHKALFFYMASLVRKMDDLPPNLAGDVVKTILQGSLYPQTLLQHTLRRIRSDFEPSLENERMRTALLKAYLNRKQRFYKTTDKEITVSLDTTNQNIGYRLGRLFATLEKLQEEAQGGNLNSTIKDRYYNAASSTPFTVYPQLFRLKNHHLAKISKEGRKVFFEKLIGEIMDGILADGFPAHLNLDDQARFAIGYYHQRQEFFKSKEEK